MHGDPQRQRLSVEEARAYLEKVVDQFHVGPLASLDLTVTWFLARGLDVADTRGKRGRWRRGQPDTREL
jgi:hypothetical protein